MPGICQPRERAFPEETNAGRCCICADISAAFLPFLNKITNKAPPAAVSFIGLLLDKSQITGEAWATGSWGRSEHALLPHWCVRWLQLLLGRSGLAASCPLGQGKGVGGSTYQFRGGRRASPSSLSLAENGLVMLRNPGNFHGCSGCGWGEKSGQADLECS